MIRIKTEITFFYKIHNPLKPNIHNISLQLDACIAVPSNFQNLMLITGTH
jgi:hypothetical protein